MSLHVCRYRGHSSTCNIDETNIQIPNISTLPWGHRDKYNCCSVVKWKTQPSLTQIVPSNSRPIPQPRVWRAPGRPLPSLNLNNLDCDVNVNCMADDNNTPLNTQSIDHREYLSYTDICPTECSWRNSRVFGSTKKIAPSRPIKHWRKQLFPRQMIDTNGIPITTNLGTGPYANRGRKGTLLTTTDTPGSAITINIRENPIMDPEFGNLQTVSCIPIYIPHTQITSSCDQLRESKICLDALVRSRPGLNVQFNKHTFSSGKAYLQSRVKLHNQQSIIQFDKTSSLPVLGWQSSINYPLQYGQSLITVSLYLRNKKDCFTATDCSCVVPVTFKPRNQAFTTYSSVDAGINTKRYRRQAITRNQYNVTNTWGINGYDTIKDWPLLQYRTRGYRRYAGNSGSGALNGRCCPKNEPFVHGIKPVPEFCPIKVNLDHQYKISHPPDPQIMNNIVITSDI